MNHTGPACTLAAFQFEPSVPLLLDLQSRSTVPGAAVGVLAGAADGMMTAGLLAVGAAGPTGNRYGDAAGHSCMAVAGLEQSAMTLETGSTDRLANMHLFAVTALNLLLQNLSR